MKRCLGPCGALKSVAEFSPGRSTCRACRRIADRRTKQRAVLRQRLAERDRIHALISWPRP